MAEKLVEALRAIQPEDRIDALSKFLAALHPAERSFVCKTTLQQNDPLFMLPLDIVLVTFEHLDICAIWSLRSVCKRWQYVLSSDLVVRSALARWQTHHDSDTASPPHRASTYSTESRIQHIRALISGSPLEDTTFDRPGVQIPRALAQLASFRFCFKGSRFAYIASRKEKGDQVIVHHLLTGEHRILCSEARETILSLVITTQLVAFVAFDGYLYVSRFCEGGDHCHRIRIPSSKVWSFAADEDSIALVLTPHISGTVRSAFDLILYDAGSQQSRSLDLSKQLQYMSNRGAEFCMSLVHSGRQVIDFFTLNSKEERQYEGVHIVHSRLSLQGELLCKQSRLQLTEFQKSQLKFPFVIATPHPSGYRDQYRLAVGEIHKPGGSPWVLNSDTLFDCKHGKFVDDQPPPNLRPNEDLPGMNLLWKGTLHQPRGEDEWMPYIAYMNDTFMVSLECTERYPGPPRTRFRAFCYDPNVKMVGRR